jgi:hypothetical protein
MVAASDPPSKQTFCFNVLTNARIGWAVTPEWSLSLTGFNLQQGKHQEFAPGDAIPRSVYLETRVKI